MKCLADKKVRRELGDADNDLNIIMASLQEANTWLTDVLTQRGYNGNLPKVMVNKVPKKK